MLNQTVTVPAISCGLGPLLSTPVTGSMLVLRTTGRKSGLVRDAPLGYVLLDGQIVVIAGYGRTCHWFLNALAHPQVQVALPGAVINGQAEEILDPGRRRLALRALVTAFGPIGRTFLGDVAHADDAHVDLLAESFPMLAITPTGILPGPYDPEGDFWKIILGATGAILAVLAIRRRRR